MNQEHVGNFIKQSLAAGLPQTKIAELLERAQQISTRKSTKTASANLSNIVTGLLAGAGLDKTASSVAYTNGILKEALDNGATPDQAVSFAKEALDATKTKLAYINKIAAIANDPELSQYAEGFLKAAMEAGLSEQDATNALLDLVDREKRANSELFKQPMGADAGPGAGGPPSDDGSGAPGADGPPGPGGDDASNILASLSPEEQQALIQQLLAMISGGQGGQGTPPGGPGGPPPGGPAGGPAGAPPMGMPPGMPGAQ